MAEVDGGQVVTILRAVFRDAMDGIGVMRGGALLVANASMVGLFGCGDEAEVVGRPFTDWVAPADRARLAELLVRPGVQTPSGLQTITLRRADGAEVLVGLRSSPFWWGGERWDVVALRQTDPGSAEALYRAVFEANTAVKLLIDPSTGAIVDANEAAEAFYGWPLAVLRSMTIGEINAVPADTLSRDLAQVQQGALRWFRRCHRTASGAVRHVEVHSGAVEVLGRSLLLSIVQDVTEQVQLEERLQEARRLESIGLVAAGVAHDFANLHTILLSCADSLARELPPESPGRGHLQDVLHAARRAGELARRLVDAGQPHPRPGPEPRDLGPAIRALVPFLQKAAGSAVEVVAALTDGLPVAIEDDQLERVLVNLVLNARDAGARRVWIETSSPPGAVVLRVRDDGAGMSASVRSRAFDPFFTTRSERRGRGLGLSAVRGIVTHGGGTITIAPADGSGTTLEIRWPRSDGAFRVLLVEDEPEVREVLQQALATHGFDVTGCADPAAARALSDDALRSFRAVVTDQRMPGTSGVELAAELTVRHPGLGVVLISGDLSPTARAALPPSWRFLRKPFTGRELGEILRRA